LPLLGIETHQGADNFFHHAQLVLGITSVEFPAFNPLWVALAPERSCSLGFCNLLSE
jgi:hypothetical protein